MNANQYVRLCGCGCGQPSPLAKKPNATYGHVKGQPVRFIAGHNNRLRMKPSVPCVISDCGKVADTRGWCAMHYERWRKHGDPTVVVFIPTEGCKVAECDGKHSAHGYCLKHATRLRRHGDLLGKYPREDQVTRFWMRVDKSADGGCWEWTAARSDTGYGSFHRDDHTTLGAHRFSYELHNGPIPAGLHVCHTCDNPPCVNPAHLIAGTREENMQDMLAKGRGRPGGRQYTPKETAA